MFVTCSSLAVPINALTVQAVYAQKNEDGHLHIETASHTVVPSYFGFEQLYSLWICLMSF